MILLLLSSICKSYFSLFQTYYLFFTACWCNNKTWRVLHFRCSLWYGIRSVQILVCSPVYDLKVYLYRGRCASNGHFEEISLKTIIIIILFFNVLIYQKYLIIFIVSFLNIIQNCIVNIRNTSKFQQLRKIREI